MPLPRITGNSFAGSPVAARPKARFTPPQQAFERIQGISRRLQEVLANPQPSPTFSGGLQEFGSTGSRGWEQYPEFAQAANSRQSPLQPAPPEIDLSPAARNQRTSLGQGRMMPGGEQMQDRFMGGSPLAAQAGYLAQGQGLAAAGLGTMIPGPYGQIGQFIPKRQGVMEDVEASMPGRLSTPTDQPASGFTRQNEGGLAYTSRAQALRDAGQGRAAQDLEARQAERVARVKRDREAAGLPVGPAERRAERDQKKMDRMLKVQGRQLQRMGISPLSPQAALLAPEAFNRAKEAMQGGAGGGASALTNAAGEPVPLVAQGAGKTPTSIGQAQTAYRALLEQTPLFKSAGVELGQEGGSPPALNQVVPKVNSWLKESNGAMSERDLEGLHQLAVQAAHNATKNSNPFEGGWSPMFASGSEETRLSLEKMKELSEIPLNNKQKRKAWWNSYSQNILGLNQKPAAPLQNIFNDNGRPQVGDTDWGQEPPGVFGRFMGMF